MSEPAGVESTEPEALELPAQGDAAFGDLMDFLVGQEDDTPAGEAGAEAAAPAAGDGPAAAPGEGKPAAAGAAGAPATGADGKPAVPGAGDLAPGADDADARVAAALADAAGQGRPAEWTRPAAELAPKFGELSTALEEKVARSHHEEALEATKAEHSKYFEEIQKHPRLLIGQTVPKIGGAEGEMETLRDAADAKEWQDAVKSVLVEEVRDRATRALEENSTFLTTLHASIELFQNNADLVPGTKDFDVELANRFTSLAEPYELRVDGKLQGYSVPVQPLIEKLRAELVTARTAAAAATPPAAPNASQARDQPTGRYTKADQPQAGIQSKAGASSDQGDDFQAGLFGTLGLPDFRV